MVNEHAASVAGLFALPCCCICIMHVTCYCGQRQEGGREGAVMFAVGAVGHV